MTRDIVIIGGGAIGLAIAVELKLRGAKVTVLCRDLQAAASSAAAGMLAPDAEQITDAAMKSLCWRSRSLYPEWTRKLEDLTGLNTGYWPCGILAPVYEASSSPNSPSSPVGERSRTTSPSSSQSPVPNGSCCRAPIIEAYITLPKLNQCFYNLRGDFITPACNICLLIHHN
jgi:hypothetical protein